MDADAEIVDSLNALLAGELTAMEQYLIQGRMLENWGYKRLSERLLHESEDEHGHAARLMQRILFLGGRPDPAKRLAFEVGETPLEILENDLALEKRMAAALNAAVALCRQQEDNGTRQLLEELLVDTEMDHLLWFEQQVGVIRVIGIERYLAEQLSA